MSQLTKYAIIDTFLKLLSEKRLPRITVKEIADMCGINRMTFYYHFKDIYDLADCTLSEGFRKIAGSLDPDGKNWEQWQIALGHAARSHRSLMQNFMDAVPYERIVKYLYDETGPVLMTIIGTYDPEDRVSPENKHMIADFLKCAVVGMELEWIKSGMQESPESYTRRLRTLIRGVIPLTLSNFYGEAEESPLRETI